MTTWSTWRDGVDSWVIHGVTEGGLGFDLAFRSEGARNEAWNVLEGENLSGEDRFIYGLPGLLDTNLGVARFYGQQVRSDEMAAERA